MCLGHAITVILCHSYYIYLLPRKRKKEPASIGLDLPKWFCSKHSPFLPWGGREAVCETYMPRRRQQLRTHCCWRRALYLHPRALRVALVCYMPCVTVVLPNIAVVASLPTFTCAFSIPSYSLVHSSMPAMNGRPFHWAFYYRTTRTVVLHSCWWHGVEGIHYGVEQQDRLPRPAVRSRIVP